MRYQWKIFEKMIEDRNFDLFGGPKWSKNQAYEAYIQHNYKSSSNDCKPKLMRQ